MVRACAVRALARQRAPGALGGSHREVAGCRHTAGHVAGTTARGWLRERVPGTPALFPSVTASHSVLPQLIPAKAAWLPALCALAALAVVSPAGCLDELLRLLAAANYSRSTDQIIFVGDLVDKGPRSPDLVRWARQEGVLAVRGNHDDAMLGYIQRFRRRHTPWWRGARGAATGREGGGGASGAHKRAAVAAAAGAGSRAARLRAEAALLASPMAEWATDPVAAGLGLPAEYGYVANLSLQDISYLERLPYTLAVPEEGLVMVHAGLLPGRSLYAQVRTAGKRAPRRDAVGRRSTRAHAKLLQRRALRARRACRAHHSPLRARCTLNSGRGRPPLLARRLRARPALVAPRSDT